MDDKKTISFKMGSSVGFTGTASMTQSMEGETKIIHIEQRGSTISNVIPSVVVVCEDDLAKEVLGMVAAESKGSYKIITAGAWENMPALLYGIYFYREQLRASGDRRYLEVVCVIDGDIREKDFNEGLDKVHSGNNVPGDMKRALALAKENLYGFHLDCIRPFGGLPEYHHQLWLNEVSPEVVAAHHQESVSNLEAALGQAEEKHMDIIETQLGFLKMDMAEVNRIAEASRGIPYHTLRNEKDKIDCHKFYDELRVNLAKGNSLMKYSLHHLEYAVLSLIRQYNPVRWNAYVAPVKEAMEKAFELHVKIFTPDRFNLSEIGSGD